jgi:hypothetical protein
MALIQLDLGVVDQPDLEVKKATALYDTKIQLTKELMEAKNHDYGEAWRNEFTNRLNLQNYFALSKLKITKEKLLFQDRC